MTRLALALSRKHIASLKADHVFLWDGTPTDTFKSHLHPSLESLGSVPTLNADFVRIALTVYSADRTIPRSGGGSNWNSRDLQVLIPVSNQLIWQGLSEDLSHAVNFLTGDTWHFEFYEDFGPSAPPSLVPQANRRVVLMSGGADSASGALISSSQLGDCEVEALLSHSSSGASASSPQARVAASLEKLYPGKNVCHKVFLNRVKASIDGTRFPTEPSSRSRSLLFLALGLAIAAQSNCILWIPENGFASLNPPLGPERIGALSTRTTQPWFLWRVSQIIRSAGGHGDIENPFQNMTKGEMFREVEAILGLEAASEYLSSTNSCSHTDQRHQKVPTGTHCGVCFGCVVRRAAFRAAGIPDVTRYLANDGRPFADYVMQKSILEAARDFVAAGISDATIMSMALPPNVLAAQAKDLSERGLAEIRDYLS